MTHNKIKKYAKRTRIETIEDLIDRFGFSELWDTINRRTRIEMEKAIDETIYAAMEDLIRDHGTIT